MTTLPPRILVLLLVSTALLAVGCEMEQRVVSRSGWSAVFSPDNEWYDGPETGSDGSAATSRCWSSRSMHRTARNYLSSGIRQAM